MGNGRDPQESVAQPLETALNDEVTHCLHAAQPDLQSPKIAACIVGHQSNPDVEKTPALEETMADCRRWDANLPPLGLMILDALETINNADGSWWREICDWMNEYTIAMKS